MVKELFDLARVTQKDDRLPGFRAQQWYFFFVAAFYMYLRCASIRITACICGFRRQLTRRFIKTNLLVELTTTRSLTAFFAWLLTRHTIISYSLYISGALPSFAECSR